MSARLRREDGWAVVTAVLVITIMMALGLGTYSFVGGQQAQSRTERVGMSAFNLAESALNSEVVFLGMPNNWPGTAGQAYPGCTQSSTATTCPDPASVADGFTAPDYAGQPTWTTTVRDNGAPNTSYYSDAVTGAQPAYDANGDGSVWVRSEAVVRGRRRAVVALAKVLPVGEDFPRNAATVGKYMTSNNGRRPVLSVGSSSLSVRCTTATGPSTTDPCLRFDQTKGQVYPNSVNQGLVGSACPSGVTECAMTDPALDRIRQRAKAAGTYWGPGGLAGCPTNLNGALIFVEDTAACGGLSFAGGNTWNSKAAPGMLVIATGTLSFVGNNTYYGLVYAANRAQSTAWNVVSLSGSSQIIGAIVVDYDGGLTANNSNSLVYDPNVFGLVTSTTVGVPPGSFRDLLVH